MSIQNRFAFFGYPSSSDDFSKNWKSIADLSSIQTKSTQKNFKKYKNKKQKRINNINEEQVLPSKTQPKRTNKIVALDCEMVGVGCIGEESMLARVSCLNFEGNVIYDTFVAPSEPIFDYRTQFSGVIPSLLIGAPSFKEVQEKVASLIKGKIIIGHSLNNDLNILRLTHPSKNIRDTSLYKPLRVNKNSSRPSLKSLSSRYLDRQIQKNTHCSVEDARCCLEIYKIFCSRWEKDMAST
ncbi:hypothetical protein HZS_6194, partial [Henneguya salminicola]